VCAVRSLFVVAQHQTDGVQTTAMETPDDALQPCAQLNTLPDELKAYIARLCAEQDDAVREAFADLSRRFTAKHPLSSDIQGFKSKLKSSIGALYGTSKRWQQIAAQYRFQVRLVFIRI
jgi:hypothetical protein